MSTSMVDLHARPIHIITYERALALSGSTKFDEALIRQAVSNSTTLFSSLTEGCAGHCSSSAVASAGLSEERYAVFTVRPAEERESSSASSSERVSVPCLLIGPASIAHVVRGVPIVALPLSTVASVGPLDLRSKDSEWTYLTFMDDSRVRPIGSLCWAEGVEGGDEENSARLLPYGANGTTASRGETQFDTDEDEVADLFPILEMCAGSDMEELRLAAKRYYSYNSPKTAPLGGAPLGVSTDAVLGIVNLASPGPFPSRISCDEKGNGQRVRRLAICKGSSSSSSSSSSRAHPQEDRSIFSCVCQSEQSVRELLIRDEEDAILELCCLIRDRWDRRFGRRKRVALSIEVQKDDGVESFGAINTQTVDKSTDKNIIPRVILEALLRRCRVGTVGVNLYCCSHDVILPAFAPKLESSELEVRHMPVDDDAHAQSNFTDGPVVTARRLSTEVEKANQLSHSEGERHSGLVADSSATPREAHGCASEVILESELEGYRGDSADVIGRRISSGASDASAADEWVLVAEHSHDTREGERKEENEGGEVKDTQAADLHIGGRLLTVAHALVTVHTELPSAPTNGASPVEKAIYAARSTLTRRRSVLEGEMDLVLEPMFTLYKADSNPLSDTDVGIGCEEDGYLHRRKANGEVVNSEIFVPNGGTLTLYTRRNRIKRLVGGKNSDLGDRPSPIHVEERTELAPLDTPQGILPTPTQEETERRGKYSHGLVGNKLKHVKAVRRFDLRLLVDITRVRLPEDTPAVFSKTCVSPELSTVADQRAGLGAARKLSEKEERPSDISDADNNESARNSESDNGGYDVLSAEEVAGIVDSNGGGNRSERKEKYHLCGDIGLRLTFLDAGTRLMSRRLQDEGIEDDGHPTHHDAVETALIRAGRMPRYILNLRFPSANACGDLYEKIIRLSSRYLIAALRDAKHSLKPYASFLEVEEEDEECHGTSLPQKKGGRGYYGQDEKDQRATAAILSKVPERHAVDSFISHFLSGGRGSGKSPLSLDAFSLQRLIFRGGERPTSLGEEAADLPHGSPPFVLRYEEGWIARDLPPPPPTKGIVRLAREHYTYRNAKLENNNKITENTLGSFTEWSISCLTLPCINDRSNGLDSGLPPPQTVGIDARKEEGKDTNTIPFYLSPDVSGDGLVKETMARMLVIKPMQRLDVKGFVTSRGEQSLTRKTILLPVQSFEVAHVRGGVGAEDMDAQMRTNSRHWGSIIDEDLNSTSLEIIFDERRVVQYLEPIAVHTNQVPAEKKSNLTASYPETQTPQDPFIKYRRKARVAIDGMRAQWALGQATTTTPETTATRFASTTRSLRIEFGSHLEQAQWRLWFEACQGPLSMEYKRQAQEYELSQKRARLDELLDELDEASLARRSAAGEYHPIVRGVIESRVGGGSGGMFPPFVSAATEGSVMKSRPTAQLLKRMLLVAPEWMIGEARRIVTRDMRVVYDGLALVCRKRAAFIELPVQKRREIEAGLLSSPPLGICSPSVDTCTGSTSDDGDDEGSAPFDFGEEERHRHGDMVLMPSQRKRQRINSKVAMHEAREPLFAHLLHVEGQAAGLTANRLRHVPEDNSLHQPEPDYHYRCDGNPSSGEPTEGVSFEQERGSVSVSSPKAKRRLEESSKGDTRTDDSSSLPDDFAEFRGMQSKNKKISVPTDCIFYRAAGEVLPSDISDSPHTFGRVVVVEGLHAGLQFAKSEGFKEADPIATSVLPSLAKPFFTFSSRGMALEDLADVPVSVEEGKGVADLSALKGNTHQRALLKAQTMLAALCTAMAFDVLGLLEGIDTLVDASMWTLRIPIEDKPQDQVARENEFADTCQRNAEETANSSEKVIVSSSSLSLRLRPLSMVPARSASKGRGGRQSLLDVALEVSFLQPMHEVPLFAKAFRFVEFGNNTQSPPVRVSRGEEGAVVHALLGLNNSPIKHAPSQNEEGPEDELFDRRGRVQEGDYHTLISRQGFPEDGAVSNASGRLISPRLAGGLLIGGELFGADAHHGTTITSPLLASVPLPPLAHLRHLYPPAGGAMGDREGSSPAKLLSPAYVIHPARSISGERSISQPRTASTEEDDPDGAMAAQALFAEYLRNQHELLKQRKGERRQTEGSVYTPKPQTHAGAHLLSPCPLSPCEHEIVLREDDEEAARADLHISIDPSEEEAEIEDLVLQQLDHERASMLKARLTSRGAPRLPPPNQRRMSPTIPRAAMIVMDDI